MTELEKIEARQTELRDVVRVVKAELRSLEARRGELLTLEEARKAVEALSPEQRDALAQVIRPAGIPSQAAVGAPHA